MPTYFTPNSLDMSAVCLIFAADMVSDGRNCICYFYPECSSGETDKSYCVCMYTMYTMYPNATANGSLATCYEMIHIATD